MTRSHTRCRLTSLTCPHKSFYSKIRLLLIALIVCLGTLVYIFSQDKKIIFNNVHYKNLTNSKPIAHRSFSHQPLSHRPQSDTQDSRLLRLRSNCEISEGKNKTFTSEDFKHIIVDDNYGIMYCYIPKVACSNWKRIFLLLTGEFHGTYSKPEEIEHNAVHFKYKNKLKMLGNYSTKGIYKRVSMYKKFMFVRDPLERLLSAYRDKFAGNGFKDKTFQKKAKLIYNYTHPNHKSDMDTIKKGTVTFLDFVSYITDDKKVNNESFTFDEHWERQNKLCHPCYLDYDFLGKYETLDEDAHVVLKQTGIYPKYSFPKRSSFYNSTKTNEIFNSYFSSLPHFYLQKLWRMYMKDYLLFGYKFPFQTSETQ